MKNIFRNPNKSVAAKLIIAIGLLMIVVSFVFWYAILHKQNKDIMFIAVDYGETFIDFAKKSTFSSMSSNDREETRKVIENLSIPEGVHSLRIFDHSGTVRYSSSKERAAESVARGSQACKSCHTDPANSSELSPTPKKWSVYKDEEGNTTLKIVDRIPNELACFTASCHAHPKDQEILGFIEADLSLSLLDKTLFKQSLALTAYVAMFVLVVSICLIVILYKVVSKPVNSLVTGMGKVAGGDLEHTVEVTSSDEIGVLAKSFNAMIRDLKNAREERELWTHTLEDEVAKKTEEIQNTHASLVQTEKLASLGRMAAGVAHEINNPLTGVITFAHLLQKKVPKDGPESEDINVIIEQAERCSKIIKNLLTFARATPSEKGNVSITEVLNRTIFMLQNQAKFRHVKFDLTCKDEQYIVSGDASQFQQIFLNLFINAADAMDGRGKITIYAREISETDNSYVELEFADEGNGIKEEDMSKLFEPFYTTKPIGKGTGLGLSVSHGIVKHLGGHITVKSTVGKGTSFFVRLPMEKTNL